MIYKRNWSFFCALFFGKAHHPVRRKTSFYGAMADGCVAGPDTVPLTRSLLAQGWTAAALLTTCIPAGEFNNYPDIIIFPSQMNGILSIGANAFEGAKGVVIQDPWPSLRFIGHSAFAGQNGTAAHAGSIVDWTAENALPKLEVIDSEAFRDFAGKLTISTTVPNLRMVGDFAFSGIGEMPCMVGARVDVYSGVSKNSAVEFTAVVVGTKNPPVPPSKTSRMIWVEHHDKDKHEAMWLEGKFVRLAGTHGPTCFDLSGGSGNIVRLDGFKALGRFGSNVFSETNAVIEIVGTLSLSTLTISPGLSAVIAQDAFQGMTAGDGIVTISFAAETCTGFPQQTFGIPSSFCTSTNEEYTSSAAQCVFGQCSADLFCYTNYRTIYDGLPDMTVRGYCLPALSFCNMLNGGAGCARKTDKCVAKEESSNCFKNVGTHPSSCFECVRVLPSIGAVDTTSSTTTAATSTPTTPRTITSKTVAFSPTSPPPSKSMANLIIGCFGGLAAGVGLGLLLFWFRNSATCSKFSCYKPEKHFLDDYALALHDTDWSESDVELEQYEHNVLRL